MTDKAIGDIKAQGRSITFSWFRNRFKVDNGLKESLASGHAVLPTVPHLDQYLWTHGRMIESQWECSAHLLGSIEPPDQVIDYGCGQGLAGLLIDDLTTPSLLADAEHLLLIEPSALSLERAKAIYAAIAPQARINAVCKRFDDLREADMVGAVGSHTLHVFSNSLDVLGFAPDALLDLTLKPGRHTILSVSHDRGFNGGSPRVKSVGDALQKRNGNDLTIKRSILEGFTCTNPSQSEGIVWLCELEVHDG